MITRQVPVAEFSAADAADLRTLMNELLDTCQSIAEQRGDGGWKASVPDLPGQSAESMVIIADISRALARTRRGIRKIHSRARFRAHTGRELPELP
ncbi:MULTISPECIES: hypothetical protein [unclassified Streptomyces]|uniref:hypothetical protein n=1 Tax=unclassified Streptomyces TaxID=2593676 RepID=UPI0036EC6EFB